MDVVPVGNNIHYYPFIFLHDPGVIILVKRQAHIRLDAKEFFRSLNSVEFLSNIFLC
jgi:hypothetical protein